MTKFSARTCHRSPAGVIQAGPQAQDHEVHFSVKFADVPSKAGSHCGLTCLLSWDRLGPGFPALPIQGTYIQGKWNRVRGCGGL